MLSAVQGADQPKPLLVWLSRLFEQHHPLVWALGHLFQQTCRVLAARPSQPPSLSALIAKVCRPLTCLCLWRPVAPLQLEAQFAGAPVVVVGVHSAKFDNERDRCVRSRGMSGSGRLVVVPLPLSLGHLPALKWYHGSCLCGA